jgi:hypothetical protein
MVSNQTGLVSDNSSFIQELDPRKLIPIICNQLLGIHEKTERDGNKEVLIIKRYSKPTFTEEFVSDIRHTLYGYINDVTSFSRYEEESISLRIKHLGKELVTLFAIKGNDHFISEQTWQLILKINDSKESWKEFKIGWEYDKPVTYEMISYVKDFDENVDQEVTFMQVSSQLRRIIDSVYRRSVVMPDNYGMMPSLINNTHSESYNATRNMQQQAAMIQQQQQGGGFG